MEPDRIEEFLKKATDKTLSKIKNGKLAHDEQIQAGCLYVLAKTIAKMADLIKIGVAE